MRRDIPFYLIARESCFEFLEDQHEIIDLLDSQLSDDPSVQRFSDAISEEWDDEELRLQVFGPDFTEETLKDTLDLCEAVEAINKGYIL
ncbi:hypothetical protein [Rhizobium sp. Leaf341]|uniref:hypothetical protein n=1 Tax=Rhizobium sp. Leaf341 TaxID=1736344 RepID=UPI00071251FF|nr:hypothetical protein [Rhizobium sp. Leaf341]KQR67890.1 hypothetical protein ASG03_10240 [Rhizobium sp. Leaf341]